MAKQDLPYDALRVPGPGEVVAEKYRVERSLGGGGMGVVVEATHLALHERVALKFLHPRLLGREVPVSRFLREAQTAARIKSEHVARVLDVAVLPSGLPFMVLELLEGQDLGRLLRARGPLPIAEAVGLVVQACAGAAEAHALGIVHRDLKPGNLFLTRAADGAPLVKVLDFGISKIRAADEAGLGELTLTVTDDVLGSPQYMAPEQLRTPKDVDARADVWSLGMILYRLVTGQHAFEGESPAALLAALVADEPIPMRARRAEVPVELEAIVMRCLSKNRALRFAGASELAEALLPFAPPVLAFPAGFRFGTTSPGAITGGGGSGSGLGSASGAQLASAPAADATHGAWTASSSPRRRGPAFAVAAAVGAALATALFVGIQLGRTQGAAAPAAAARSTESLVAPEPVERDEPASASTGAAPSAAPSTTAPHAAPSTAPSADPPATASASAEPAKKPRRVPRAAARPGVDPLDDRL